MIQVASNKGHTEIVIDEAQYNPLKKISIVNFKILLIGFRILLRKSSYQLCLNH